MTNELQRIIVVILAFCSVAYAADRGERARLLGPFREKLHRVVFTKHFDMGGSHYAYTDAVSDEDKLNPGGVKKEFNFKPGSSLCMLSLDEGLNVWETTLIHDDNGVIRDPDVSYDGKRILFAWGRAWPTTRGSIFRTATSCSAPRDASRMWTAGT